MSVKIPVIDLYIIDFFGDRALKEGKNSQVVTKTFNFFLNIF